MAFTNILFPVDFSERSCAIAPHVRAACNRFNASLTLIHFVGAPFIAYGTADAPVVFNFPMDELKESARKHLNEFAATAFPGMSVKTLVREGDPDLCVAAMAQSMKIDLIMMPSRGRGRFRAALLGSVTAKTLHDATCPVWTEAHCEEAGTQHVEWRRIVCALDTNEEGTRLIGVTAGLAATSHAAVHLVHAVPVANMIVERSGGPEFPEFLKSTARQAIARMQAQAGTHFQMCVEAGEIPQVIRHAALSHEADLVLIGRGVLPRLAGGLRSHTYPIVRDMPCPVLSV